MPCQMPQSTFTNLLALHQPLGGAQGQASDIEIQANEIIRLKKLLNGIIAENTDKTIEEVESDTNRDYYLTAEEAVEYGLVDHVLEMPDK